MECPECFVNFNEVGRLPKALPCGHTYCLECLEEVDRCFEDHKKFMEIPTELPNNKNVIAMMRSNSGKSDNCLSIWCMSCEAKASECCIDVGHKVCNRKKVLFEQARQKLHLSEQKLDLQHYEKLVDNLDEANAAQALELLSGPIAPIDVLLQGKGVRWKAPLQLNEAIDEKMGDQKAKMMRCLLYLLKLEGTIQKDLYLPHNDRSQETQPKEEIDPETLLDLTNISSCRNLESVKADKDALLASDSLLKVKRLTGLYCDPDKKWSLQLLELLAPNLEEVHLYHFHLKHLEVVQRMPQLRWLVLENLNDKIKAVDKDYKVPPLKHKSLVEFLWCNVSGYRNEKLCSDIIKSYESSLKVLLAAVPSYHGNTVEFFDKLNMPNLENLFYINNYCGNQSCKEQMNSLREKYPNVFCFKCGRTDMYDS
ncbi:uncharacterized protein LOC117647263 [Thrips palmi]|uniref:Uncharacterized protein LOC117647263 n=1 Tax=Thrips palmi TaxID=161013 RepID=A0A6P8ZB85_THRPL|nr:uncharacterized protein LOC117647263 [Thrips palmi]XP_034244846.1 uncharacterized protein LOC117647263 [Thrips palmi]XP_034244847.1 uncharacterized protein LOC117647263 [Thrips palmi]